jgi:hypothetical protein
VKDGKKIFETNPFGDCNGAITVTISLPKKGWNGVISSYPYENMSLDQDLLTTI